MAEYLSVDWTAARKAAAHYLGYGLTPGNWTDGTDSTEDQVSVLQNVLDTGYRYFLNPPKVENVLGQHTWRFLRKQATLTTVVDQYNYTLPEDFGAIAEPLTFPAESMICHHPVHVSEEDIRRIRQGNIISGEPSLYAVRPKDQGTIGLSPAGQRWEIILHPPPDAVWAMPYAYDVQVAPLSETNAYPLGGPQMAQLFLEAVLMACEHLVLNIGGGPHERLFMQLLPGCIQKDRMLGPTHLGQMRGTEGHEMVRRSDVPRYGRVTYDGVYYEG